MTKSKDAAAHSLKVVSDWFDIQWKETDGKGTMKNINTVTPFYTLVSLIDDGKFTDPKWKGWCEEWGQWIMDGLPRTEQGGFQHSE